MSIFLMILISLPGLAYLGLVIYYQDSFMYGTWINGIYCTGKTVQEAARELEKAFEYDVVYVVTPQNVETLEVASLDLQYDFEGALEEYRKEQNPLKWYRQRMLGHQKEQLHPKITLNEDRLEEWLYTTKSYESNLALGEDHLSLVLGDNGYEIQEEKEKILNTILAKEAIAEVIKNAGTEINLEEAGCFFTREETLEMQQVRELYEKIEKLQNCSLTYKLKDTQKKVTPKEIALWIATDQDGNPMLDREGELTFDKKAVSAFVEQMAEEYDTWQNFPFTTHDGRNIVLKKGNYGTKIYQQKEVSYLMAYLEEPVEVIREPAYIRNITYNDSNAIKDTYVEVDMTAQKMFFFSEGKKVLETDVVTGCTSKKMGTPEVVCYVYNKARNAILKGKNYRTFVNYWVAVYGGIGLHDATWRQEFGGEIYKKSGSHGCVNTPLEKMEELYDMLEVGMPVVIHN